MVTVVVQPNTQVRRNVVANAAARADRRSGDRLCR